MIWSAIPIPLLMACVDSYLWRQSRRYFIHNFTYAMCRCLPSMEIQQQLMSFTLSRDCVHSFSITDNITSCHLQDLINVHRTWILVIYVRAWHSFCNLSDLCIVCGKVVLHLMRVGSGKDAILANPVGVSMLITNIIQIFITPTRHIHKQRWFSGHIFGNLHGVG